MAICSWWDFIKAKWSLKKVGLAALGGSDGEDGVLLTCMGSLIRNFTVSLFNFRFWGSWTIATPEPNVKWQFFWCRMMSYDGSFFENVAKAQFTGRTAAQRQLVAMLSCRQYREHVTFLGTVTCGHARGPLDKELGRIQHCRKRMVALLSCRLHVDTFQRYARAFCVSMVAYGWFAKLPPLYISTSLWHLVKHGEGTAWLGNTWLRGIVEGGNTHLDVVTASALFRVVASLRQKQLCLWHRTSGAPVAVLRKWLSSHGWVEISPWKWRLEGLSLNISLGSAASLAGNLHACGMLAALS